MGSKIYEEEKIALETSYDWREGWISTAATVRDKMIAEYVANEGPRIYVDDRWDEGKTHDDEDADDFIGVRTGTGVVSLCDWMGEHEETSSVSQEYCNDVGTAYADFILRGKKTLSWKSDRGFANAGWYWTDDDPPDNSVDTDDSDTVWDLKNKAEYQEAKEQLAEQYAAKYHKMMYPAEFHEQRLLPSRTMRNLSGTHSKSNSRLLGGRQKISLTMEARRKKNGKNKSYRVF